MHRLTLAVALLAALIVVLMTGTAAGGGEVSASANAANGAPVRNDVQVSPAVKHDVDQLVQVPELRLNA